MKSDRLSFNTAIARNTLRRCWPLWAAYLVYLIITLPVSLQSFIRVNAWRSNLPTWVTDLNFQILNLVMDQAKAAIVIGMLAVMVLFGYLYSSRGNTLMNSLPVKRESLFLTLYLTGIVPMLLCQILVLALTFAMTAGSGIEGKNYLVWLACAALGLIFFYGFSCFCAMLTGNLVVLPAVYLVLNFTAAAFEAAVSECVSTLVYGLSGLAPRFQWLSPFAYLDQKMMLFSNPDGSVTFSGLSALWLYAAAGLVFAVLAALLYRRRRMECVSDFVAIPVLKPIFRICMAAGTAFVGAAFLFGSFFSQTVYGSAAAWLMAVLLILGAVLGWVAAEMMIRRSVRVFPMPWKGLVAVCACCVLTVLVAEADLTGYETRIPEPAQVESATLCFETELTEPENILALEALHREVIGKKAFYDGGMDAARSAAKAQAMLESDAAALDAAQAEGEEFYTLYFPVEYRLADGTVLHRDYNLVYPADDVDNPETTVGKVVSLLNCPEAVMSRMDTAVPMKAENIRRAEIGVEDSDGRWYQVRLTPDELLDLWQTAMLPDAEDGNLALYTVTDTEKNLADQTNLSIEISLSDLTDNPYYPDTTQQHYWYHNFRVFTFSGRTLQWIEAHTDLTWKTLKQVREEQEAYNQSMEMAWG